MTVAVNSIVSGGTTTINVSSNLMSSASRILAAAGNYVTRIVSASPPTITVGASGGSSTISGGGSAGFPNILGNDARIRTTGPVQSIFSSYFGAWTNDDILLDGGDGWGVGFQTNSANVEFSVSSGIDGQAVRIRINDQWISATDTLLFTTADFGFHLVKIAFGSTAERKVEIFLRHSTDFGGINLVAGATLQLPATDAYNVKAEYFGDSYIEANSGIGVRSNFGQVFGEVMGVADQVPRGRSNQGWVLQRDGRTIGSRMVTDTAFTSSADIYYCHGSINDKNQSISTLTANVTTGISSLMTQRPNAWIVCFSGFRTQNDANDFAHAKAFCDGVVAAAGGDPRVILIDTWASGWPIVAATTGTLPDGTLHDSSEGDHPGPNETRYLTQILCKPAVMAAMSAILGRQGLATLSITAQAINITPTDASGTPGNVTQNVLRGRAAIAAVASTCVVTNSNVTATSQILLTIQGNDTTLKSATATPATGSFTVQGNAAATATVKFDYTVITP